MNVIEQARTAYSLSAAPIRTPRTTEYEAFARITRQIKDAMMASDQTYPRLVQALHENRKLWTLLAGEVSDSENQLPDTLRAQIFYLAEFTQQHSSKVLAQTATADVLVEINTSMMQGLRSHGATK